MSSNESSKKLFCEWLEKEPFSNDVMSTKIKSLKELIPAGISILRGEKICGISSGLPSMDSITNGWQPGEIISVAAAPGVGKTILIQDFIYRAHVPSLVFTLGWPAEKFAAWHIAKAVGAHPSNKGELQDKQNQEMFLDDCGLNAEGIYIDDTPRLDIKTFRDRCSQMVEQNGVQLIAICGPVQWMTLPNPPEDSSWQKELLEIIEDVQRTARILHVPIIFESKVSDGYRLRADEYDMNDFPGERDLYGGDIIAPFIDKIMLLHWPLVENPDTTRCFLIKGFSSDSKYIDLKMDYEYSTFKEVYKTIKSCTNS